MTVFIFETILLICQTVSTKALCLLHYGNIGHPVGQLSLVFTKGQQIYKFHSLFVPVTHHG